MNVVGEARYGIPCTLCHDEKSVEHVLPCPRLSVCDCFASHDYAFAEADEEVTTIGPSHITPAQQHHITTP